MDASLPVELVSNEDVKWLINKAKESTTQNQYSAKAWMIVAQTLFPQNYHIQFESYELEKNSGNVKEAAKALEKMYLNYPQVTSLLGEVKLILESVHSSKKSDESLVLSEIFSELPTSVQCQMLLSVANQIEDHLEQCHLLFLAMKHFSSLVQEQGMKLIEKLLWAERQATLNSPVNAYRKLLVFDVVPLVINKCQGQLTSKQLYKWLQKSIQFYVCYSALPPDSSDTDNVSRKEIFSPLRACSGKGATSSNLLDLQSSIANPWTAVHSILIKVGAALGWEIDTHFFSQTMENQWQQVQNLYNRDMQSHSLQHQKQILFTVVVMYIEAIFQYTSSVHPSAFQHGAASQRLILLNSLLTESQDESKCSINKKAKVERSLDEIVGSSALVTNAGDISKHFVIAVRCYDLLLSTELLKKDFLKLRQLWQMDIWSWLTTFTTDMLMYKGSYSDSVAILDKELSTKDMKDKIPLQLQSAVCCHLLGDNFKSCEILLNVINLLDLTNDVKTKVSLGSDHSLISTDSQYILLTNATPDIIPYCIHLLFSIFKTEFNKGNDNDALIGHLIILLQCYWPKYHGTFRNCIDAITAKGKWKFPLFFNFIINVDVLEECSFIQSPQGDNIHMDVFSQDYKPPLRTLTRGVNRETKNDFCQAMEAQMSRCQESVSDLIITFICSHQDSIISSLRAT